MGLGLGYACLSGRVDPLHVCKACQHVPAGKPGLIAREFVCGWLRPWYLHIIQASRRAAVLCHAMR